MIQAPEGTEWTGEPLGRSLTRMTPEMAANKTLAEKRNLNDRTRLSWNPDKVPVKGEAKFVGKLCLSLPYVNVEKRYFIQNCRIFRSNGTEIDLAKVYEETGAGPLYLRVKESFDNHVASALEHDPNLCKYCKKFRADSIDRMMQHIVDEHPDAIAKMAGVELPEAAPAQAGTDTVSFWCESCDKTFKNAGGLRLHRLKKHDRAA